MLTIEYTITKIQARILLITGGLWLIWGLWSGGDPLTIAWRATAGGVVAMVISGYLLRLGARIIADRLQEIEAQQQGESTSQGAAA